MTGGLMQLVGKGAQDTLLTGNPSFTHFKAVYKRHTEFAMEHFRLYFRGKNLALPPSGSITLRTTVDRNAQLLHDCYLSITIPDIYSPLIPGSQPVVGHQFQWVPNLGYNLINYVSVLINGSEVVRHTGEWMKLYAALTFDGNKKAVLDELIGNVPELYDPANAFGRINQYPHSISTATSPAAPSIRGRVLTIPLHFWFCEHIGSALPLVALQHSQVEIVVELKNMYQLFTVNGAAITNTTPMSTFLSPPIYGNPYTPVNPTLQLWDMAPFLECNYIFVSDAEMAHIAKSDHSFKITQIDLREARGQYGPSNDLDLIMRNMCTRIVWVAQRSDRIIQNDYDNYTNWANYKVPPILATDTSSGIQQIPAITQKDILLESVIVLDGKERFTPKQTEFFNHIQHYRHHSGTSITQLPGIYTYSFALDHDTHQPSGAINGSQFNKTILRNTYIQPPIGSQTGVQVPATQVCVLRSTLSSTNPTVIPNPNAVDPLTGLRLYSPNDLITIVQKTDANTFTYTYHVRAYVESYNFVRVIGGVANVVFSS